MGKTILIDIDDTILNLIPSWVDWLNNNYNIEINEQEITDWEIHNYFPTLTKEQVYAPLFIDEFWNNVRPKEDAQIYIKKLIDDKHDIFLCSASNFHSLRYKIQQCVLHYFPYLHENKIIIIPTGKKQMLKADYLIDDYEYNLIGGEYKGLLFDTPHNKNFDLEPYPNISRVYNWEQIYKLIS